MRASLAVEGRLFAALAVVRIAVLLNALALNAYRDNFDRPALAWTVLGGMVLWTAVVIGLATRPERRTRWLLGADLALAVAALALTPVAKGPWFEASIPGFWIVGALLAWAVRFGWRGGVLAGIVLGATDLLARDQITQGNLGLVFLLLLAGAAVGFVSESLQDLAAQRDRAQRQAAAAAERVRLGRAVHDGVLQVLALVQRRGAAAGGDWAELGRLAGEQETSLRRLIRTQDTAEPADDPTQVDLVDLVGELGTLVAARGAELAAPATAVRLPASVAGEVVAVVGACLDNVARHVGTAAPAWVLVEDLADRVTVSVRDEGPGIAPGRLEAARAEGRLGVSESICGRIRDLGGKAHLHTSRHGTEWEFEVPT